MKRKGLESFSGVGSPVFEGVDFIPVYGIFSTSVKAMIELGSFGNYEIDEAVKRVVSRIGGFGAVCSYNVGLACICKVAYEIATT